MRYTVLGLNMASAVGLYMSYGFVFFLAGLGAFLELCFEGNAEDLGGIFLMTCLPLILTTVILILNIIAQISFKKSRKFFAVSEPICGILSIVLYVGLIALTFWLDDSWFHVLNDVSIRMQIASVICWLLGILLNIAVIFLSIAAACKDERGIPKEVTA